jgi:hypothetical protein
LHAVLERRGERVNVKRVYRLYAEEGLPSCSISCIHGSLSITLQCLQYVVLLADNFFLSQLGSFDRRRLNHAKYLSADRFINGNATKRDATRLAVV